MGEDLDPHPVCSGSARKEKAVSSKFWPSLPGFTQPKSPTNSPDFRLLWHSLSSLQRCVKTFLSISPLDSTSSMTARNSLSASVRERLTCLLRTLSTVLLHSLCFNNMCLNRTCDGISSFRARFCGGGASEDEDASCRCSNCTTMEPKPSWSVTCPSHCTAASTSAPAAMRGRPALRRKTVDTATALPIALYNARQTNATPWCLFCRCTTATSGVANNR
mmetsp:Transcript_49460/g.159694  ORF Transcript_49460/g.159694 Transcript_49460/m.159694 type:complete len:219 (+) Transcript_49460:144-800(+)